MLHKQTGCTDGVTITAAAVHGMKSVWVPDSSALPDYAIVLIAIGGLLCILATVAAANLYSKARRRRLQGLNDKGGRRGSTSRASYSRGDVSMFVKLDEEEAGTEEQ